MATVYSIHGTDEDRLAEVIEDMRKLGAPTIEVVDCGDHYQALEGSHRLAAAKALGMVPNLVVREQDDMIDVTSYDWYEAQQWAETNYTAGEVAGELFSPAQAVAYSFHA